MLPSFRPEVDACILPSFALELMLDIKPWLGLYKKSMFLVENMRIDARHQPMACFAQEIDPGHRLFLKNAIDPRHQPMHRFA